MKRIRVTKSSRSNEAEVYHALYHSRRWRAVRAAQIAREPLCERCKAKGILVPTKVVHHKIPHRGDITLFWSGPFESLCNPCHSGPAQQEENRGYTNEIGPDGWPSDPRHPSNRREAG
jgi:5-methylcytosine-specific restriction endonuclease McrA